MAALENMKVTAYIKEGTGDDETWSYVTSVSTDASGDYTLSGLAPGTYKLKINDPEGDYLTEYYADASTLESATEIVVAAATTITDKDVVLGSASYISGTISDA